MTTTMENWFVFKSYNRQHIFGFGTEREADQYNDHLNEGPYYWSFHPVSTAWAKDLKLDDSDLGISLSIALADIEQAK